MAALATFGLAVILLPPAASAYGESITINPTSGTAGTKVIVTGSGWEENGSRGIRTPITVNGSPVGTAVPDSGGTFRTSITIPDFGNKRIVTEVAALTGSGGAATAQFVYVPPGGRTHPTTGQCAPSIHITPAAGAIGTNVLIKGNAWQAGGTVHISLPYGSKGIFNTPSASPSVGAQGGWQTIFKVAAPTPKGTYRFTATEAAPQCGGTITKTVTFTVT
ncbi:hypothetical protein AB0953_02845 [Streptomyces sp. NPDC046866]|uniref:hypothetical protein n=1 Tax=Streptomyces sp. NPDC046866 TaxID=3154921 RepID=UPI003453255D